MIIGRYSLSIDGGMPVVRQNLLMATFGAAACRLFGGGDRAFRINAVYIEYANSAVAVSAPSYSAMDDRTYYDNLLSPKDYLRVPVTGSPQTSIIPGYESLFTDGVHGNRLRVEADSRGSVGMNGLAFTNAANSRVYGVALVAAPVEADVTQDIIISRGYLDAADQVIKPPTGQVHVGWELDFLPAGD